MTKKFWNDWKNRIGETRQIWVYNTEHTHSHYLLDSNDKILHADFDVDNVTLLIERHRRKLKEFHIITVIENETVQLNRVNIDTIEFIRIDQ